MVLLNLMSFDLRRDYLDHLDKTEGQNLLHLLQMLVVDSSILDRFTFSTFEQVHYGIDTFHTVQKINRLLREPNLGNLLSKHICHHQFVGVMLDNFFRQNTHIDFDLLLNALGIHYEISENTLITLAKAFRGIFYIDEDLNCLHVQDFILFTDMISLSQFLLALENG